VLAPVYPTLIARTPARLGEATSVRAIGFRSAGAPWARRGCPAALGVLALRAGLDAVAPAIAAAVVLLALHELLVRLTPPADR
jgi:hypothetical protein